MGGHDVPLTGHDPEDHHLRREHGRHGHRDLLRVITQPPVILPVHLLDLGEVFIIRRKYQVGVLSAKILDLDR